MCNFIVSHRLCKRSPYTRQVRDWNGCYKDINQPMRSTKQHLLCGRASICTYIWRPTRSSNHCTVLFKTRGHLSRLAWPTQRDGLSCLASPRLALRCAAWPSKTNPDSCSRPVVTSGCSHRYYNGIMHNAKYINIAFFMVRQAMFLNKNDCLKW